jgi:5-methylcytosine-specific restriction protein A
MPHTPKKPCRFAGCPNLTDDTYCTEHKKLLDKQYNHFQRNQTAQSFYDSYAWRKLRARYLIENPLCVECRRQGKLTKATLVDHIVPISKGGEPLEESNLQPLCWNCHSSKSISEGSRFGNK